MDRIRSFSWVAVPLLSALFAVFPLTDTDIWWHLACAREWYFTWSPVRLPAINVHEFFQQAVYAVYNVGGPAALVLVKAILWGIVFALFLFPFRREWRNFPVLVAGSAVLLFIFRFYLELRPVLFSLLFLGAYWNLLPKIFSDLLPVRRRIVMAFVVFALQWLWCRCQGLYILGPLLAVAVFFPQIVNAKVRTARWFLYPCAFVVLLFLIPFLHGDGLRLFLYPFGLLDRLLGLTPSAAAFASGIAENRSPFTLLLEGENVLVSALAVLVTLVSLVYSMVNLIKYRRDFVLNVSLSVTAVLALVAERNFVLLLPLFMVVLSRLFTCFSSLNKVYSQNINLFINGVSVVIIAFVLGFWTRSLMAYDSWIAYQRVPVGAAAWMKAHPHQGRLFNDDRAGGYLAFVNPADSVYADGRFILKTADFFERYLRYVGDPELFMADADSLGVDRAVFPLRFYARWGQVLDALAASPEWESGYVDEYYIVFCKK